MTGQDKKDIVAGLAIFSSMSYVVFAIPLLLGPKFPAGPVFFATCAIACLASFAAGYFARCPTAVAPGIALSAIIYDFMSAKGSAIQWEVALAVSFFAGLILLATSLSGARRVIVDAIPTTIKLALAGGIGALLAENALTLLHPPAAQAADNVILFVIGLSFIVVGYVILRNAAMLLQDRSYAGWLDILGRLSLFLSVIVVAFAAHKFFPGAAKAPLPSGGWWIWAERTMEWKKIFIETINSQSIALLIFILYILHADILGSPYFMALEDKKFKSEDLDPKENATIHTSFKVDSIANVIAPLIGSPPAVYYAENHGGKVLGGRGPMVTYVVALGFLGLFVFGVALKAFGKPIEHVVPEIAVAPVLFFVGLIIIAKSLAHTIEHAGANAAAHTPQNVDAKDIFDMGRYLPAAITIVVTPVAGFAVGVSCGIISYALFFAVPSKEKEPAVFWILVGMAVLAIAHKLYMVLS